MSDFFTPQNSMYTKKYCHSFLILQISTNQNLI